MKSFHSYLRLSHAPDCSCSVCASHHLPASVPSPSAPCTQCRPAQLYQVSGHWYSQPASYCDRHSPRQRPANYWHTVFDSGKPTPYLPFREPEHDH
ncbi:hypothetical protein HNP49_003398 [Pseudomonas fluvialis]|uniref:Uncharacterized protein n=1 Tax=Pseudomonas fluvialis TaxID=1793966 RepID=A0A7X0BWN2_9PSED|nr:DUF5447 family protein [Pseudomonas fluvialis]MBB6343200.1 hypothetical protein [Pseudomonas fluvialis]